MDLKAGAHWLHAGILDATTITVALRNYCYELKYLLLFEGPSPLYKCSVVLLLCVGTLILHLLLRSHRHRRSKTSDLAPALAALSTLMLPNNSRWPPAFITIAHQASLSAHRTITVPLSLLHTHVKSGRLELKSVANNFPALLRHNFSANGWRIRLRVESIWWRRLRWRMFISRISYTRMKPEEFISFNTTEEGLCAIISPGSFSACMPLEPSGQELSQQGRIVALDTISESYLPSFIQGLGHRSDRMLVLTFVTRGTSEALGDESQVLASLPSLFPRYVSMQCSATSDAHKSPRTLPPFQTSLDAIIKILTSDYSPFLVESIRNASGDYADALRAYVEKLETNDQKRKEFVKACGIGGWREERFLTAWEAALFASGLLCRWVVVVHKR